MLINCVILILGGQAIKARASAFEPTGATTPGISSQDKADSRDYNFKNRASGFLALIRPIFFILTPLNAGSAAVLALGHYPSLATCLAGFFAVALASCAVNVFNDYTDRERDRLIWPERAIPSGRVKPNEALLLVLAALAISLTIAWFVFNPAAFITLLIAILLGGVYSAWLRDKVGYLALPPIVGIIYLGGWAALSPETLFNSWLPWYLYLIGVVWQAGHIMVYYPLHLTSDSDSKAPPALFFTPSPQAAVGIGFAFACLTLLLGIGLFFIAPLPPLYLVLVVISGGYALLRILPLLKDPRHHQRGIKAFTSLSIFRMVISAAILLSVLISPF